MWLYLQFFRVWIQLVMSIKYLEPVKTLSWFWSQTYQEREQSRIYMCLCYSGCRKGTQASWNYHAGCFSYGPPYWTPFYYFSPWKGSAPSPKVENRRRNNTPMCPSHVMWPEAGLLAWSLDPSQWFPMFLCQNRRYFCSSRGLCVPEVWSVRHGKHGVHCICQTPF